jgi:hypothetical protein
MALSLNGRTVGMELTLKKLAKLALSNVSVNSFLLSSNDLNRTTLTVSGTLNSALASGTKV